MAIGQSQYGDLTPRSAAFIQRDLLMRAQPYLVFEKFGQSKPLPKNETKSMKFRRYERILKDTTPLVEGVTPDAVKMTYTDVTSTISQYGKRIEFSDTVLNTHEDDIWGESKDILAQQAAETVEDIRFGILKAGTNVDKCAA